MSTYEVIMMIVAIVGVLVGVSGLILAFVAYLENKK